MKTKSRINRTLQLAFGPAILALLVVGAISYRAILESRESDRWVWHTHEVLEDLQDLPLEKQGVESNYRGSVATGHQQSLQHHRGSILRSEEQETTIRNLAEDYPIQQQLIPTFEGPAHQNIQYSETVLDLRRTKGLETAADAIRDGEGERIMDEFQGVIRVMPAEQRQPLLEGNADTGRRFYQSKVVLILGVASGLLMAALVYWIVQRYYAARGRAEEAFLESEERLRILVEGVQDYAIFRLDPCGKVVSWNAGAERIKGYKAGEIIGQNFSRFYLQKDIDEGKPQKELQIAAASGRTETELWRVRKDGSRFWANVVITAARNSSGSLLGFSEISRDISARRETEAKYRGLLEAAPDAMVVVNEGGEIVLLNVQAEKHFGYSRDELVGQKVKNIIPEGFAERLIADGTRTAAEALAQQIGTGIELTGRRKDGSDFPIEIMLSPLESAQGILVTAAIRDISVRKDAERHLEQMEGRYRGLLEAAPDAMVVVNQSGGIVLLNFQAEKQFGYHRDELVGQQVKNIIPEGFAERLVADARRTAAEALAQQIGTGIELTGRRKDGSDFPIEIMLSPLESAEGILVTAAIRDISVRKKSEEHLLKTVGELKRSNDELEQFAYVASHDLQEPLRMVASYTQLLAKRYKGRLDSDADEFIAYAVDGSNRMQRLIQDLLAYSRAGTNGKALCRVSSEKALEEAITNLRAAVEESGAIVTHDLLPAITTDDTLLVQILQNLVGNAIKYRSAEIPHIHVSAAKNGGTEWIFSVHDNGLGIEPQYFERIFILFQRLHGRNEFAGTGIGLAICKKMLERLGGRIWVESQPEKGSTFFFSLPERDAK
ncbi:MAG: PAS domain S-box protein [Candidatus Acidiferrales bacterium]